MAFNEINDIDAEQARTRGRALIRKIGTEREWKALRQAHGVELCSSTTNTTCSHAQSTTTVHSDLSEIREYFSINEDLRLRRHLEPHFGKYLQSSSVLGSWSAFASSSEDCIEFLSLKSVMLAPSITQGFRPRELLYYDYVVQMNKGQVVTDGGQLLEAPILLRVCFSSPDATTGYDKCTFFTSMVAQSSPRHPQSIHVQMESTVVESDKRPTRKLVQRMASMLSTLQQQLVQFRLQQRLRDPEWESYIALSSTANTDECGLCCRRLHAFRRKYECGICHLLYCHRCCKKKHILHDMLEKPYKDRICSRCLTVEGVSLSHPPAANEDMQHQGQEEEEVSEDEDDDYITMRSYSQVSLDYNADEDDEHMETQGRKTYTLYDPAIFPTKSVPIEEAPTERECESSGTKIPYALIHSDEYPWPVAPRPSNEAARVNHMMQMQIVECAVGDISFRKKLVAYCDQTRTAVNWMSVSINLIAQDKVFCIASAGIDDMTTEMDRALSPSSHTLMSSSPLIVLNLENDLRFAMHPICTALHLKSYASFPIISAGLCIGTFDVASAESELPFDRKTMQSLQETTELIAHAFEQHCRDQRAQRQSSRMSFTPKYEQAGKSSEIASTIVELLSKAQATSKTVEHQKQEMSNQVA